MERKFYLRGLGLGIAVTAVIMGIITSRDSGMSDKEIIARAKELGMVENTVLSENSAEVSGEADKPEAGDGDAGLSGDDSTAASDEEDDIGNSTEAEVTKPPGEAGTVENPAGVDDADEVENGGKTESVEVEDDATDLSEAGIAEGNAEEDARDLITSAAVKTITVNRGDGSHTVAKKLADVGVVTSAENFDAFLCQNGYDKKLRTGTFSIPADASDEQIARIVTGAE